MDSVDIKSFPQKSQPIVMSAPKKYSVFLFIISFSLDGLLMNI